MATYVDNTWNRLKGFHPAAVSFAFFDPDRHVTCTYCGREVPRKRTFDWGCEHCIINQRIDEPRGILKVDDTDGETMLVDTMYYRRKDVHANKVLINEALKFNSDIWPDGIYEYLEQWHTGCSIAK